MAGTREVSQHELSLMKKACQKFDLPFANCKLFKGRQNLVFGVSGESDDSDELDEAVIRIAYASPLAAARVRKIVEVTPELTRLGAPVTPLLRERFVTVGDGLFATAWKWCPSDPEKETLEALGETTRKLHEIGIPRLAKSYHLPAWDSLSDLRKRLKAAIELDTISPKDAQYLTDEANKVDRELELLRHEFRPVVVHGDAHPDNLVGGLFADLDAISWGPRGVDAATSFTREKRFHIPDAFKRFSAGYGEDLSNESGFEVLLRARELKNLAGCLSRLKEVPVRKEFDKRVESMRVKGGEKVQWNILPERPDSTSDNASIHVPNLPTRADPTRIVNNNNRKRPKR